jgi:hypothetical protein
MNVGVMKDYKLRDLRASHTLFFVFIVYLQLNKKKRIRFLKFHSGPIRFWGNGAACPFTDA